jgi:hypothetical protein
MNPTITMHYRHFQLVAVEQAGAFVVESVLVGCSEDQVGAIVGMSSAMVRHYAKEVSKFRLARSAMQLLETGWESQRVHVLGAKKETG